MSLSLRSPILIENNYISTEEDAKEFQLCRFNPRNYLTREEVEALFPKGYITHSRFYHLGGFYRLVHRFVADRLMYAALLEEDSAPARSDALASWTGGRNSPSRVVQMIPSIPSSSNQLDRALDRAMASPRTSLNNMNLDALRAYMAMQQRYQLPSSSSTTAPGEGPDKNKFIEDLLTANDSPVPLDRYKALSRLMSNLRRQLESAHILNVELPQSWNHQDHMDLLKRILLVGESLARFGTADFQQSTNSSRAITAKDYTTLLTQYLDRNGLVFATPFIAGLDQNTQDEVLTVRSLLETRCEANSLIFGQLIKHVGLEGKGAGASTTMVYNASVVNANPTNNVTASPTNTTTTETTTTTSTTASALAKIKSMQSQWPLLLAGAAGLLVMWKGGRALFGGRGRKQPDRSSRRPSDPSDTEDEVVPRRRRSTASQHEAHTERVAAQMLVACQQEMNKLLHNQELLENDWRLGKFRLASPGNPYPPGYSSPQPLACSLHDFYRVLSSDPNSMYIPPTQMYMHSFPPSPVMVPPQPITDPRRLLPAPRDVAQAATNAAAAAATAAPSLLEVFAAGASNAAAEPVEVGSGSQASRAA